MRILVISDTHIPVAEEKLPEAIIAEAHKSDICLHAGDFIDMRVLDTLKEITRVFGVRGNMDSQEIRKNLPDKQIIDAGKFKIGLTHGKGAPANIIYTVTQIFHNEFDKIDIFIFGHSHIPEDKVVNEKIFFNPGSPTDKIFTPYRSYGILEIEGNNIKRRIVRL